MFNKLKEAVKISMDTLAPPPPLHDDFIYHWKKFMKNYTNISTETTPAIQQTYLPECLDKLKNILVEEDQLLTDNVVNDVGPCMEYLLKNNLMDLLVSLAICDEPPGMKSCILMFIASLITQIKEPNIAHSSLYIPFMKMMNMCDGLLHSVSEKEEIEFLLCLSGVLRKQQTFAILFFSDENAKLLEESSQAKEFNQYGNILDLVLSYVDSADTDVRVKACQCILLLCSLDDEEILGCILNNYKFNHFIIGRLVTLFYEIGPTDYEFFKDIEARWTLDIPQESQLELIKNRSAIVFFIWVDFINQLCIECHETIKNKLCESITKYYLQEVFNPDFLSNEETLAIFHKYYKMITSPTLQRGFHKWLILSDFDENENDIDALNITKNTIVQSLLNNCVSNKEFTELTSLEFFLDLLGRCDEDFLHKFIFCYLKDRLYFDINAQSTSWSEEEDERQKSLNNPGCSTCRTMSPSNIDKIIKSFENLIPIQLRLQTNQETMFYIQNQYGEVMNLCSKFEWPREAISNIDNANTNDCDLESDIFSKRFFEGPFLRVIFNKIRNFHQLSLEQMAVISSIISKLALLPHPFLHEYLLNPSLPLKEEAPSLYASLSHVVSVVSSRVQMIVNYKEELRVTKEKLLSDPSSNNSRNDIDRYLQACVLLEELNVEIATIIYVKYSYNYS